MSPALFLFFPPGFSWCFSHVYSSEWTKVILWIFSFSKKKKNFQNKKQYFISDFIRIISDLKIIHLRNKCYFCNIESANNKVLSPHLLDLFKPFSRI